MIGNIAYHQPIFEEKEMKNVLGFICVSFVKALKADLGVNGEIWEYDFGGMMGTAPVGLNDSFVWNALGVIIFLWYAQTTPEQALTLLLLSYMYSFLFVLFIFPMVKGVLRIEFPPDNKLHWPTRVR